jgi:hypothetical protein
MKIQLRVGDLISNETAQILEIKAIIIDFNFNEGWNDFEDPKTIIILVNYITDKPLRVDLKYIQDKLNEKVWEIQ